MPKSLCLVLLEDSFVVGGLYSDVCYSDHHFARVQCFLHQLSGLLDAVR
ncbi:hypothetical protein SP19_91 [Salmonella phage 19]|nr:hypothetical protein SP19_91 [Salmonella phage 19]